MWAIARTVVSFKSFSTMSWHLTIICSSSMQEKASSRMRISGFFMTALRNNVSFWLVTDKSEKLSLAWTARMSSNLPRRVWAWGVSSSLGAINVKFELATFGTRPFMMTCIIVLFPGTRAWSSGDEMPILSLTSKNDTPFPVFLRTPSMLNTDLHDCGWSAVINESNVVFPVLLSPKIRHFDPRGIFQSKLANMGKSL